MSERHEVMGTRQGGGGIHEWAGLGEVGSESRELSLNGESRIKEKPIKWRGITPKSISLILTGFSSTQRKSHVTNKSLKERR